MKILILGNDARADALRQHFEKHGHEVLVAPGNGGIPREQCCEFDSTDFTTVKNFAKSNEIDLVIPSGEALLAKGIVDFLEQSGVPTIGPAQYAAKLEASKSFTKEICDFADIPSAVWETTTAYTVAERIIDAWEGVPVIKADGLCGGKGVIVPESKVEAKRAARDMLEQRIFGIAGSRIVIEQRLLGEECSVMALVDGEHVVFLPTARDYKRLVEGDKGPNTGGMGSYSPHKTVTPELLEKIKKLIFMPTLQEMKQRGTPVRGLLYAGLMLTAEGPKLLEWNVRLGDPETQSILVRIKSDLLPYLLATRVGNLHELPPLEIDPRPAVTVVAASPGYPKKPEVGFPIRIPQKLGENVRIFHAGVRRRENGVLVTDGGRVVSVTALGNSIELAARDAYHTLMQIHFQDMHARTDIASGL